MTTSTAISDADLIAFVVREARMLERQEHADVARAGVPGADEGDDEQRHEGRQNKCQDRNPSKT